MLDRKPTLSSYMTHLLSKGQVVFSREDAQKALGIGRGAFLDAAERQQRRKHLIRPRRGFYAIVPPQYLAWGAPPPSWYIDSLMRHESCLYYVGLLKAAELHGATHHAVMEFQVITNKRLPNIRAGRSVVVFYYRKDMDKVISGIGNHKTDTGFMNVSSVELTILDLMRYPNAAGGLDNIMTVLRGLAERVDASEFVELSSSFERSVLQRLGYMLENLGYTEISEPLYAFVSGNFSLPWVELEPSRAAAQDLVSEPVERNRRWGVIVRRVPEADG